MLKFKTSEVNCNMFKGWKAGWKGKTLHLIYIKVNKNESKLYWFASNYILKFNFNAGNHSHYLLIVKCKPICSGPFAFKSNGNESGSKEFLVLRSHFFSPSPPLSLPSLSLHASPSLPFPLFLSLSLPLPLFLFPSLSLSFPPSSSPILSHNSPSLPPFLSPSLFLPPLSLSPSLSSSLPPSLSLHLPLSLPPSLSIPSSPLSPSLPPSLPPSLSSLSLPLACV